jgi:3-hydroxyisobutyrate dehydrogenase
MLPDSDAVEQVALGQGGLFDVLEAGALVLDMGSSVPRRTVALARRAAEAGLELADAPVSGGLAKACSGELTAMFGGTPEQLERCRPALDAMTATVVPMGPVGSGHAMKALNNVMSATGLSIACEVIEVGRRFGLDPDLMVEVLNGSTGRNHATETKVRQFVLSESFDSGFLLRLMLKDLRIAADLADDVGAATPLADACRELWAGAAEVLPADADQTRIAELPRERA